MFVLILVASNDLGGALLYFFTYLVMIYVATKRFYIFAGGLAFVGLGMYAGYHLFSHVKNRIVAWLDPLSVPAANWPGTESISVPGWTWHPLWHRRKRCVPG